MTRLALLLVLLAGPAVARADDRLCMPDQATMERLCAAGTCKVCPVSHRSFWLSQYNDTGRTVCSLHGRQWVSKTPGKCAVDDEPQ